MWLFLERFLIRFILKLMLMQLPARVAPVAQARILWWVQSVVPEQPVAPVEPLMLIHTLAD